MAVFYALLTVCLFGGALAQFSSLGRCPDVQTTPNFDVSKYAGRWYEAERLFVATEIDSKCNTADYSLGENDTIKMSNARVSTINGNTWSVDEIARVPDPANPSKFKVKLAIDPIGFETDYWVLGTDYKNYAVVYNCINVLLTKTQYVWILTRERKPEQSVIDQALEVIKKNNLDKLSFLKTNQDDC